MDHPYHNIFLNINSEIEYKVRLFSCKKGPETLEWLQSFKEKEIFYYIGDIELYLSKRSHLMNF